MKIYLPLIIFLFLFQGLPATAQDADYSKARLISSVQGTGDLAAIDMGLEITMKDQWYTYWRMPGDAGIAPVFDWSASKNVKDVEVFWPTPKRFETMGINSFGYDGTMLFPLRLTPEEKGKDIRINLKLDLMICHDICIPHTITIERLFSAGPATPSEEAGLIKTAIEALPAKDDDGDISIGTAILGKNAVVVTVKSKEPLDDNTDMIIESERGIFSRPPEIIPPSSEGGDYVLKINGPEGADLTQELFGKTVTVLVIHNGKAIEKQVAF